MSLSDFNTVWRCCLFLVGLWNSGDLQACSSIFARQDYLTKSLLCQISFCFWELVTWTRKNVRRIDPYISLNSRWASWNSLCDESSLISFYDFVSSQWGHAVLRISPMNAIISFVSLYHRLLCLVLIISNYMLVLPKYRAELDELYA
jgi:hypothetical protein